MPTNRADTETATRRSEDSRSCLSLLPPRNSSLCLLDRLTDDDPSHQEESRNQRVISLQRYFRGVLRDLQWLFNASACLDSDPSFAARRRNFPRPAVPCLTLAYASFAERRRRTWIGCRNNSAKPFIFLNPAFSPAHCPSGLMPIAIF